MDEVKVSVDDLVETQDSFVMNATVEEVAQQNALIVYRVKPDDDMSDREKEIWEETLNSVTVGWISEKDRHQLANYCRAIAEIEFFDQQLNLIKNSSSFDPTDKAYYQAYSRWSEMRSKAKATVLAHARALRLTNSAVRTDSQTSADVVAKKKVWQKK